MISYPTYESLAVDLDLHLFDKISVLREVGMYLEDGSWLVVTDDGHCHLVDENGNLDDINKITTIFSNYIRKDIKKIIIPDSVTSIRGWAFNCCTRLIDVAIPNSVKSIGVYTFFGCSGLKSVLIGNGITSIGDSAFEFCSSLTNVTIGNSVTIIGPQVFYGCKNLKSVFFKGKTLKQVKAMSDYPWGIEDKNIIETL